MARARDRNETYWKIVYRHYLLSMPTIDTFMCRIFDVGALKTPRFTMREIGEVQLGHVHNYRMMCTQARPHTYTHPLIPCIGAYLGGFICSNVWILGQITYIGKWQKQTHQIENVTTKSNVCAVCFPAIKSLAYECLISINVDHFITLFDHWRSQRRAIHRRKQWMVAALSAINVI